MRGVYDNMNELINPMDYDKITDDVYYMGNGVYLRLNVILARRREDGTRRHFISNYKYQSKYIDQGKVITMRRSFDYFLTLESIFDRTQNVMIRVQNMILFKSKIREAVKWFSDNRVFGLKRNKLIIAGKPDPIILTGLAANKTISLEPVVINYEDSQEQKPGIRVTLNESSVYTDMSIDNFYGLVYIVDTFNMYQSAQIIVSSLGHMENAMVMEYDNEDVNEHENEVPNSIKAKDGRKPIGLKQNRSYFDMIDDM